MISPKTDIAPEVVASPAAAVRARPVLSSPAEKLLVTLAVLAALWWGQRFLIPLTAGLMLAVLVVPLVRWLHRLLRSTVAATVVTLALVMAALAAGAVAFGAQLIRVAERAPEMISMVAQQVAATEPAAGSLMKRARDALQELDRAADRVVSGKPPSRPGRRAAPVALQSASASAAAVPNQNITNGATEALRGTALTGSGALFGFVGTLSIIFFVAFFVLAGGKPLVDHFLGLWGYSAEAHEHAQRAWQECARQVRLYAGVLLVTNTVIGVCVWLAFLMADLPDAAGWGITAAVLHVVPYLGMALLTVLGAAETFLVHETLGATLGMAAFLVLLSTLIGTFVTAWLQSRAAKMNPAAVFVGLLLWGALWGVWGLFLGPVLVVMFKVVAEHTRGGLRLARLMRG